MLGAVQLMAASCLFGATSVDFGVASEAATRTVSIEGTSAQSALDASISPRVGLIVDESRLRLAVGYVPSLRWADTMSGRGLEGPDVMHGAHLTMSYQVDHRWRLGVAGSAAYGTRNFLATPVTSPTGSQAFQAVPTLSELRYGSGNASVSLAHDLERDLRATASLGYSIDGGVDGPSQATLPVARSIRLMSGLAWDATRTASLGTSLDVVANDLAASRRAVSALLRATWRQRSGPHDEWWLGAGGSGYYEEGAGRPAGSGILPAGEAGYEHTILIQTEQGATEQTGPGQATHGGQRIVERIAVRATPDFDRLTGDVLERVEVTGSAGWALGERWRVAATLNGGLIPRSNEAPASLVTGEASAGWRPGKLEIRCGVRALWQRDFRVSAQPIREIGGFLGVTFADVEPL